MPATIYVTVVPIKGTGKVTGTFQTTNLLVTPMVGTGRLTGTFLGPLSLVSTGLVGVGKLLGTWHRAYDKKNFVRWSDIGSINFTFNQENIAGEIPMEWNGWVYAIRKLIPMGGSIVYGENGVTLLRPKPGAGDYAMDTLYRVGLKSKGAVTGDENIHYFVDNLGQLWKVEKGLERLHYDEFLSTMGSIVMSYDKRNGLVYICDGTYGFVYSTIGNSFGEGPANVSGIGYKDDTLYVGAPSTITFPAFEICTDVYDLGTRKYKVIESLDVSTDLPSGNYLYASADYRKDYGAEMSSTDWVLVNPNGKAYTKCFGVEFQFRLKALSYVLFRLDWIKVNGLIYQYSPRSVEGGTTLRGA